MTALRETRIRRDLNNVMGQVQDLVSRVGDQGADTAAGLRERMSGWAGVARGRLSTLNDSARDNARYAARATDSYVRENPWRAIGAGAAIGLLLGYLASRRRY
jgi:ElaB/YqjD/DUF883 family membrane-anchored ribosome-binding protein